MINRQGNKNKEVSFIPKFSDADILRAVLGSTIWKSLFLNKREAIWELFKAMYYFKSELFIIPIRSLFRVNFGSRTMGYFMVTMAMVLMIAFNSKTIWGVLINLFPFMVPLWANMMGEKQYALLLFEDIQSVPFMYFWLCTTLISYTQLILMHFRPKDAESPVKRGDSLLYYFLLGRIGFSESFVQLVIEPCLIVLMGLRFIHVQNDLTIGIFWIIGGVCLFMQEAQDSILKSFMK